MVRECVFALAALPLAGCSLILDFSESAAPLPDASPFTQAECEYKEPNDTLETAALLDVSDVGPAAICPGDAHDFYKFTVPANTAAVAVRIALVTGPTGDLDLRITDAAGSTLGQSRSFDDNEAITCPGATPPCPMLAEGEYFFDVFPGQTGFVNRYEISLTITPM